MELRSCRPEERASAIALAKSVFKENMGDQFLCLLGEKNLARIFVAAEEGLVRSMVNYYPATVKIHDALVKTGSVGSVCTNPDYRGQKLASRLLKQAEDKMLSEDITVMIISGQGGIYSAIGADFAGNCHECFVPKGFFPSSNQISLKTYRPNDFETLKSVYETETVRFLREDEEFRLLIKGQTYPDTFATYPFELILLNGAVVAYTILHLETDESSETLGIKEYGGNRKALIASFDPLLEKYGKKKMHFATDLHDELEMYLEGAEKVKIHQFASIKILNFARFMEQIKPYIERVIPESIGKLTYFEQDRTYFFRFGTEEIRIDDGMTLTELVFGNTTSSILDWSACPKIKALLDRVFPIPFAWTHNINYQ
jgi:GNAT superfamily N-acetyltransferase